MALVRRAGEHKSEGQAIVLVALALVALLAGLSLVIDGGNAFAQQRGTQNAADSAANAGAIVLMNAVVAKSNGQPSPATDADVLSAIDAKAADNHVQPPVAFYTTITGQCILAGGSVAPPPCDSAVGAVRVGSAPSGVIPTVNADAQGKPQCPLPPGGAEPALACGVAVTASRTFSTYFGGVVGINNWTATAGATAVAGVLTTLCAAGQPCNFLPITFPTTLTLCDGTGKQVDFGTNPDYQVVPPGTALTSTNEQIIGICGSGDGTVGWLAIAPEDSGNGCNGANPDLVCDIITPDNPPLTLPVWIQTVSGNTNDKDVDQAVNTYAGATVGTYELGSDQTVIIPLYDCIGTDEFQGSTDTCAQAAGKQGGQNIYFHIVSIASLVLDHAYVNANNPECNQAPGKPLIGGNGKNGCLKGWLVDISSPTGIVGTGSGLPNTVFGVQLIR